MSGFHEVLHPDEWDNETGPSDWFAIAGKDGIVAYASTERVAEAIVGMLANDPSLTREATDGWALPAKEATDG